MAKPTGAPLPPSNSAEIPVSRPPWSWHLLVVQLAAITLTLDQFTKYLVRELLPYRASFPDDGFFRFTHTHNTGSAFGIFQGQNLPLIFVSFIGIAVLLAIYFSQRRPGNLLRLSLGLQLGGAVGNLVDRVHQGWVTDFIDVGPWPVFNLADASIVTGLIMLAWIFLRPSPLGKSSRKDALDKDRAWGLAWCPICDGDMVVLDNGWRCADCGVRERIELPQPSKATFSHSLSSNSLSPEAAPAGTGFPVSPSASEGDSWGSSPRTSSRESLLSVEHDPDRPARPAVEPATGSSATGFSQPEE